MAILGRRNLLTIVRAARPGLYLDGGERGEILLPNRYVPEGAEPGETLEVFVHRDSEDRLVATTEKSLAEEGDFALLRVLSTRASLGAFLDWGLAKDLLLPRGEQNQCLREGDLVVVRILVDERSDRIVASTRLHRWLNITPARYYPEQTVKIFVTSESPLGYNAIVENAHWGLLYHAEISTPLHLGDRLTAYVRAVRSDGKIDLSLDRAGYVRVKPLSENILEALRAAGGSLPFHDKSTPAEIRDAFGVSKKAFKQAVGALYRKHKIAITDTGLRLP